MVKHTKTIVRQVVKGKGALEPEKTGCTIWSKRCSYVNPITNKRCGNRYTIGGDFCHLHRFAEDNPDTKIAIVGKSDQKKSSNDQSAKSNRLKVVLKDVIEKNPPASKVVMERGDEIMKVKGEKITRQDVIDRYGSIYGSVKTNPYVFQIGENEFLDTTCTGDPSRAIQVVTNEEDANVKADIDADGEVVIWAKRNIKQGDALKMYTGANWVDAPGIMVYKNLDGNNTDRSGATMQIPEPTMNDVEIDSEIYDPDRPNRPQVDATLRYRGQSQFVKDFWSMSRKEMNRLTTTFKNKVDRTQSSKTTLPARPSEQREVEELDAAEEKQRRRQLNKVKKKTNEVITEMRGDLPLSIPGPKIKKKPREEPEYDDDNGGGFDDDAYVGSSRAPPPSPPPPPPRPPVPRPRNNNPPRYMQLTGPPRWVHAGHLASAQGGMVLQGTFNRSQPAVEAPLPPARPPPPPPRRETRYGRPSDDVRVYDEYIPNQYRDLHWSQRRERENRDRKWRRLNRRRDDD